MLCVNYIIIACVSDNNNNTVMNNNYERLEDLTVLFRIPLDKQKQYLRNLYRVWASALENVHQPWSTMIG